MPPDDLEARRPGAKLAGVVTSVCRRHELLVVAADGEEGGTEVRGDRVVGGPGPR